MGIREVDDVSHLASLLFLSFFKSLLTSRVSYGILSCDWVTSGEEITWVFKTEVEKWRESVWLL